MICTPEQRQLCRWIDRHHDLDQIRNVEVVTKNALRLTLRGREPVVLILRQNGQVDQLQEADLYDEVC